MARKQKFDWVWEIEREGRGYIMRWVDPATKAIKQEQLEGNADERKARLKAKSKELAKARESGPAAVKKLEEAAAEYFAGLADKRENTINAYRYAVDHMLAWAKREGVVRCDQLTPGHLAKLHGHVRILKKREVQTGKGIGRGAHKHGDTILSAASRNQILRGIHTFLNHVRKLDLTPNITTDTIKDRLPYIREGKAAVKFLRAAEIAALLGAADRHDAKKFDITREENARRVGIGTTPRYQPIGAFVRTVLLSGMRFEECAGLAWREVDLEAGEIRLDPERVKTKDARTIRLEESPSLWNLLRGMKLQSDGRSHVFTTWRWNKKRETWELTQGMSRDVAETARARLMKPKTGFGAPEFTWHDLRRTCGTFLTNAPGIYAGASAYLSAKRLGHSVTIAERLYIGQVKIDPRARTLEQAMGIEALPEIEQSAGLRKVGA
jgi:integrase